MVSVNYKGGLGNKLIQHLAALIFSIKHNLKLVSQSSPFENFFLNKDEENGRVGNNIVIINDSNFINFFESNFIESNHYVFDGFFQSKEFLQTYEYQIKELLNIHYSKQNENLVFLHYRIGDISDDRRMLPLEYFEEALSNINFNGGYISSDTIDHKFCKILITKYNLTPIKMSPMETINFGKNFKNIVLSEGTFSWWIGFLSNTNNVICNKRECFWHGDIFLDRWKSLTWDYEDISVYDKCQLNTYKPKKI